MLFCVHFLTKKKRFSSPHSESPSIYVSNYLLEEGAFLNIYDPKVAEHEIIGDLKTVSHEDPNRVDKLVKVFKDPLSALKGVHAVVVLTEWDEFKDVDYQAVYDSMLKPAFIFDGRLILDHAKLKKIGFQVEVIGKVVQ